MAAATVFFFLIESSGRPLEEVDYMYIIGVPPIKSSKWDPKDAGENVNTDNLFLTSGGRNIKKRDEGGMGGVFQEENVARPTGAAEMEAGAPPVVGTGARI